MEDKIGVKVSEDRNYFAGTVPGRFGDSRRCRISLGVTRLEAASPWRG